LLTKGQGGVGLCKLIRKAKEPQYQAQTMAAFNNFIVGLASKLGFSTLPSAQRTSDAHVNRFLFNFHEFCRTLLRTAR
jgi:hypothetical protein